MKKFALVLAVLVLAAGIAVVLTVSQKKAAPSAEMKLRKTSAAVGEREAPGADKLEAEESTPEAPKPTSPTTQAVAEAAPEEPPPDLPGPSVTFFGTVTIEGGAPAAGATVEAQVPVFDGEQKTYSATTGKDGTYRLHAVDFAMLEVKASLEGYAVAATVAMNEKYFTGGLDDSSRREERLDFTLVAEGGLSGTVVNEEGAPIAGAVVSATSAQMVERFGSQGLNTGTRVEATADEEGRFSLRGVRPGAVLLAASAEGYLPNHSTVTVPTNEATLTLRRGGAQVSGYVYRLESNQAVSSATVMAIPMPTAAQTLPQEYYLPRQAVTDETGAFHFNSLPAGSYQVMASKDLLRPYRRPEQAQTPLALVDGDNKTGIELFLYGGHTVRGRVTDADSGEPLQGVAVSYGGAPYMMGGSQDLSDFRDVSEQNGYYLLTGMVGPTVMLSAVKEGYLAVKDDPYRGLMVELAEKELEVTKDIQMRKALTISGRVEFENGTPAVGATVKFEEARTSSFGTPGKPVGADGAFVVEVSPMAEGVVRAQLAGHPTAFTPVMKVRLDPITDVKIVIPKAATVSGVVLLPDGSPAAGAKVTLQQHIPMGQGVSRSEGLTSVVTGADGTFRLEEVPPGDVWVLGEKEGFAAAPRTQITVASAENRTGVELKLQEGHFLAGEVVDGEGKPVVQASVSVMDRQGFHKFTQTQADGRFRIEGVPTAGRFLQIWHNGVSKEFQDVKLDVEDQQFVLEEGETTTLIGFVVDAETGDRIKEFTVEKEASSGGGKPVRDERVPGRFTWTGLKPRWHQVLTIKAEGYVALTTPNIDVRAGEKEVERTFRLGKGSDLIGRVVDAASGDAVEGAVVEVHRGRNINYYSMAPKPVAVGKTDGDGQFTLKGVPAEDLTVRVTASGYAEKDARTRGINGETVDVGEIKLDSGDSLIVKAVNDVTGQPVAGVLVELVRGPSFVGETVGTATTDQSGVVTFSSLASGQHFLKTSNPNYYGGFDAPSMGLGEGGGPKELRLPIGSGTLRGTVMKGGKPYRARISSSYRGAPLNLTLREEISTDDQGRFELKNLVGGKWNISFRDPSDPNLYTSQEFVLGKGEALERTFIIPAGAIVVTAVDGEGEPVAAATVTATGSEEKPVTLSYPNETDSEGQYTLASLGAGMYRIQVIHPSAGRASADVVIAEEETREATVTLQPGGGTLISAVYHFESGDPVPEAWTKLKNTETGQPLNHDARRGDDGIMKIENIPAGTYEVEVSAWDHSESRRTLEIADGKTESIEDVIFPAGTLHWRILDAAGKPQVGMPYRVVPLDADSIQKPVEGKTDGDGDVYVRGVWPGNYRAEVTINGKVITETVFLEKLGTNRVNTTVE